MAAGPPAAGLLRRAASSPLLPRRRSMRALLVAGVVALLAMVGLAVAWFSPAMSVRGISVDGLDHVPRATVMDALGIRKGTPLLQVDAAAAAHRVAGIARVAEVSVHRDFPSTVRVDVTERVPVAFVDAGDGPRLIDVNGIEFARAAPPPGVPLLEAADPSDADLTKSVLGVLGRLPDGLRGQIETVTIDSPSDISFALTDDRTLEWGSVDRSGLKARVALAVLQQPGSVYDVSSPNLPTVG